MFFFFYCVQLRSSGIPAESKKCGGGSRREKFNNSSTTFPPQQKRRREERKTEKLRKIAKEKKTPRFVMELSVGCIKVGKGKSLASKSIFLIQWSKICTYFLALNNIHKHTMLERNKRSHFDSAARTLAFNSWKFKVICSKFHSFPYLFERASTPTSQLKSTLVRVEIIRIFNVCDFGFYYAYEWMKITELNRGVEIFILFIACIWISCASREHLCVLASSGHLNWVRVQHTKPRTIHVMIAAK